ncbi:MAG: tetratricopeptide repeat protein [Candidatus Hydrogenedentes bacterium]|nr:tetratricopeptide repeat protein [Candidatus Hydrogenedentota bacterium]
MLKHIAFAVIAALALCWHAPGAFAQEPGAPDDQLAFANGLFSRGFFSEAVEEYEAYLTRQPSGPDAGAAWYRLGQSAQATNQPEKALEAFRKAAELPGDAAVQAQARLSLGETLSSLKRSKEAAEILEPLAGGDRPGEVRARALYYLGRARHDLGDTDKAAAAYQTLSDSLPDHVLAPYAKYQLAYIQMDRSLFEDAAITFSQVAGNAAADPALRMESRFRTAEIYDKIGWFSAAVGAYEELKREFPDSDYAKRADYGYAWSLYHAKKYPEAAAAAEMFLKNKPDPALVPGMLYLLGNSLQQGKEYAKAVAVYRELAEKHPDSPFAAQGRGKAAWALYLNGDTAGAKTAALEFLKTEKDTLLAGETGFLLGILLAAEGNYEDARQEFRMVAEKFPESEFAPEALYKSGECLLQLGVRNEAAKIFEEFVRRYPDNPLASEAILRAGDAQFNAQDFAQAVEKYRMILDKPGDPAVEEDTLNRLAITYHNMKDYAKSAETYKALLEKFPATRHAADARFRIAEYQLREEKDALKAIESYQAVLDAKPGGELAGRALRGLALARYERKDHGMAAELFLRLSREYPQMSLPEEVYTWCGQWFYDNSRWDEAAAMLEALLKARPEYPYPDKARFTIAECAEQAGREKEALEKYQAVVDAAPTGSKAVEAKFRMAGLLEKAGNPDKAAELYESAASANVGDIAAQSRFRLGELYEKQGEHERAARNYMRVAILFLHETLSPESLWKAGECFEKAGQPVQARGAYEELVADYPESETAVRARAALERLGAAAPSGGGG